MVDPESPLRCPNCLYPLRGLKRHICPECGAAFDPEALSHRIKQLDIEPRQQTASPFKVIAILVLMLAVTIVLIDDSFVVVASALGLLIVLGPPLLVYVILKCMEISGHKSESSATELEVGSEAAKGGGDKRKLSIREIAILFLVLLIIPMILRSLLKMF